MECTPEWFLSFHTLYLDEFSSFPLFLILLQLRRSLVLVLMRLINIIMRMEPHGWKIVLPTIYHRE